MDGIDASSACCLCGAAIKEGILIVLLLFYKYIHEL